MKTALNRVFYLMTGIYPTAISGMFTAGSGTLSGYNVVLGWETMDNDVRKIPIGKYPVIILDLVENVGLRKEKIGDGFPMGYFDEWVKFRFEIVVYVAKNNNAIIGSGAIKGILDAYDDLESVLFGSEDNMQLKVTTKYAEDIRYPILVEEGVGVDESGRIFARSRRFEVEYRLLKSDY